jgi:nicotinamidase-related amidase
MTVEPIEPSRTALLVMDYQNGIMGRIENSDALLSLAAETIAKARAAGLTIGYVRVGFADGDLDGVPSTSGMMKLTRGAAGTMFHADAEATQVHDRVAPQDGDIVVRKVRVGAFGTTDLHEQLRSRGIDTLLIAGISTSGVVHSTVLDGYDRDYRQLVLADLCTDPDRAVHTVLIEQIFPKRAEVITTAELDSLLP